MSKKVRIGNVTIGGGERIAVQTMCDVKTSKIEDVIREINDVYDSGCDIIRVAVKDDDDAAALKILSKKSPIPLVADIHFDHRLALKAIDAGVHKIRINPGNIGSEEKVEEVAKALKSSGVAVRVGSNSGSVEKEFLAKFGKSEIALAESALKNVAVLERHGVSNIVISAKASNVPLMVQTYRYLAKKVDYPLHLGVTEAGTAASGIVKNSVGIGSLLLDGIGDTIRVSLTAPIKEEVLAAKRILRSVGKEKDFVEVISCPTCGRTGYDMFSLVQSVENAVANVKKHLKVAVMGCVVNGPGEAKDCDLGIAGGDGKCVIFKKGEVFRTVPMDRAKEEFLKEIEIAINND
ncbi:MAG: flavodoxin-dependent (E)-4-hydroxy-3-methylbut-2-enyl-diphosphate synthase [Clostridia bacterium]|nr:flavodoxin-dependent (E)-4-hydroxy-3-methylbut-2-enyl-diphosphate synthase [Clostridia bacterium]